MKKDWPAGFLESKYTDNCKQYKSCPKVLAQEKFIIILRKALQDSIDANTLLLKQRAELISQLHQ